MHDNTKPILRHNPEYINLHVDTNDALTLPPNEIPDNILELKIKIEEIDKDCKVIISVPNYRCDNRKAGNTVSELTNMFINLTVPTGNNKNASRKHLRYKGLHLNSYGSSRLAVNLISVIKKFRNDSSYPTDSNTVDPRFYEHGFYRIPQYIEQKVTVPSIWLTKLS